MLLLFLTVAAVLLALCIATDRSNATVTFTDGDTREGYIDVTGIDGNSGCYGLRKRDSPEPLFESCPVEEMCF